MTTWILVSDVGRAKLYTTELREDKWSLVHAFEHAEGREFSREISPSSPPGRMEQNQGLGGRHTALEPRTTPKEAESQRFAQELSDYLEKATATRQFDALVLVAPPHFLGVLNGALGRQATKLVRTTVNKDLSMFNMNEVRERLVDTVFPTNPAAS